MGERKRARELTKRKLKRAKRKRLPKAFSTVAPSLLICFAIVFITFVISVLVKNQKAAEEKELLRLNNIEQNALADMLETAYDVYMESREEVKGISFAGLVAYQLALPSGGEERTDRRILEEAVSKAIELDVSWEKAIDQRVKSKYNFLYTVYDSILHDFVGIYTVEAEADGERVLRTRYGVRNFYPIPCGFEYRHNNDYGNERTYGGNRTHEGNDIMAEEKVPVVAVEDGLVENIGWNEYGGYRLGIRSNDGKRYYYYAHMHAGQPYAEGVSKGGRIKAGDVIGFVGATGYSKVPGTTGQFESHLHIQIGVTYPGKKEQIWVNPYGILKFLENHRTAELLQDGTNEFDYRRDRTR